jgi:tetratricopeptide (TPR) repeat protein
MQARLGLLAANQTNEEMGNAINELMTVAESGDLDLPSSIGTGEPISENDSFMTLSQNMTEADEAELESRFDLAVAYREMGMLDEAIIEFQIASQIPSKTLESYIQIGRCFVEQDDSVNAIGYFFNAIESGASEALATELKYEIGSAYESANDTDLALHWYETVYSENPQFKDILSKIQALGGTVEDPSAQASGL